MDYRQYLVYLYTSKASIEITIVLLVNMQKTVKLSKRISKIKMINKIIKEVIYKLFVVCLFMNLSKFVFLFEKKEN